MEECGYQLQMARQVILEAINRMQNSNIPPVSINAGEEDPPLDYKGELGGRHRRKHSNIGGILGIKWYLIRS